MGLPKFDNPPVVQVIVSIVFERPARTTASEQFKLLEVLQSWGYWDVHEFPPLNSLDEPTDLFGAPVPEEDEIPPLRSLDIASTDGNWHFQVQTSRLTCYWLRMPGSSYPGFEEITRQVLDALERTESCRESFDSHSFERVKQLEVTYINDMPSELLSDFLDFVSPVNSVEASLEFRPLLQHLKLVSEVEQTLAPGARVYFDCIPRSQSPQQVRIAFFSAIPSPKTQDLPLFLELARRSIDYWFLSVTDKTLQREYWRLKEAK